MNFAPPGGVASKEIDGRTVGFQLYSIAALVKITGLGRTKIYEEIKLRRLQSVKVGKRRLVPASALCTWYNIYLKE